jgi:hypothetical protein
MKILANGRWSAGFTTSESDVAGTSIDFPAM